MSGDKKEKMLEKVRALLAKANDTEFEGEADVFRAKADELMTAYAIEQWQVDEADSRVGTSNRTPERRDIDISWYWKNSYSHIKHDLYHMFDQVARSCRCKPIWWSPASRRRSRLRRVAPEWNWRCVTSATCSTMQPRTCSVTNRVAALCRAMWLATRLATMPGRRRAARPASAATRRRVWADRVGS